MAENKNFTTKEIFAEEISKAITKALGNVVVESIVAKKLNENYTALTVKPEGSNVGMNINLDSIYENYVNGASFEAICSDTVSLLKTAMDNMPKQEAIDMITNYEDAKKHLVIEVVSVEANKEMLETIPHKLIEDMAIVYRLDVSGCVTEGGASVLITNRMLENYEITAEELHKDALLYAPVNRPLEIKGMAEVLTAHLDDEQADMLGFNVPPEEEQLFVASVAGNVHGAGILAYEEFMDKAAERVGGSFYLLPSSIHELLLVPDCEKVDLHMLENMVCEVNATTVDPKDKLTDSVYHYDAENKIFELGTKFIIRHAEEAEKKEDIA